MADLIIGVQGSGKSYRAVKHIFENRDKYVSILTNINEISVDGNISKLNFNKYISEIIAPLHNLYINDNNISDTFLNEEYDRLSNTPKGLKLVVIDEAQNLFNKKNDVINWLVTYHRHFNIELILISQLVKGIHSDHQIFNNVYEALNPSKQFLPNKIRYNHYLGLPANASNYLGRDNLSIDSKVFSLYGSGGAVKKKNYLVFPLILLIVLVVLLIFGFKYALGIFDSDKDNNATTSIVSASSNDVPFKVAATSTFANIKNSSVIYRYFVDESNLLISCENGLELPLKFVNEPFYISDVGVGFKYYHYIRPIKYCSIKEEESNNKDGISVTF